MGDVRQRKAERVLLAAEDQLIFRLGLVFTDEGHGGKMLAGRRQELVKCVAKELRPGCAAYSIWADGDPSLTRLHTLTAGRAGTMLAEAILTKRNHRRTLSYQGGLDLMKFGVSVFLLLSLLYPMRAGQGGEWGGLPAGAQDGTAKESSQHANPEQKVAKKTLTDIDVINMVNAGLADSTIVLDIQTSPTAFDTSPQALVFLQRGGVSQTVIDAMLTAAGGKPAPPATTPVPAPANPAAGEPEPQPGPACVRGRGSG